MIEHQKRKAFLKKLINLGIAGKGAGHSRLRNIIAVREILKGKSKALLGLEELKSLPEEKILKAISSITGCSNDITKEDGEGYINPDSTLDALIKAAFILYETCKRDKGNIILATGHPGAMLGFYIEVAEAIRKLGGNVICPGVGRSLKVYTCPNCGLHDVVEQIDCLCGVALVTNGDTFMHTHDTKPMDYMIDEAKKNNQTIDLVVADHGFAGSAINNGLNVIAIMDTNDPAIAAAQKYLNKDITIIPMDDNRPNFVTKQVGQIFKEIIFTLESGRKKFQGGKTV